MTLQRYLISVLPIFAIGMLYLFLYLLVKTGTDAIGLFLVIFFVKGAALKAG